MTIRHFISLWTLYSAVALGLAYWGLVVKMGIPNPGMDDAYIFFVYARNLAEGHGFVYFPGGEHVEGFSSPLWTIFLSMVWKYFGGFGWGLASFCILLTSLGTVISLQVFLRILSVTGLADDKSKYAIWIGAAWFGAWAFASPGYIVWGGLSLMENALWSLVWSVCVIVLLDIILLNKVNVYCLVKFVFFLIILLLCRPDGLLWSLIFGILSLFCRWFVYGYDRDFIRVFLFGLIIFSIICFSMLIFRLNYFGHPLPNTFYAKVSPDTAYNFSQGLRYLARFGLWHCGVILCVPFAVYSSISLAPAAHRRCCTGTPGDPYILFRGIVGSLVLVGLAVPLLVGGDHFAMFRLMQVCWVWLPLPFFLWLWKRQNGSAKCGSICRGAFVSIGVCVGFLSMEPWIGLSAQSPIASEFRIAGRDLRTGVLLNHFFPGEEKPLVGVRCAGAIAYSYKGRVLDLMGLNYVAMAHSPGNRHGKKNHAAFNLDVFWKNPPDVLLPYVSSGVQELEDGYRLQRARYLADPLSDPFKGLRLSPKFLGGYTLGALDDSSGQLLGGWIRNPLLEELPPGIRFLPARISF
jgi:arabinofuranosyltransferase